MEKGLQYDCEWVSAIQTSYIKEKFNRKALQDI